jgi:hypothetical protein
MDVDLSTRLVCWTDRGDPPNGNTVSRRRWTPADVGQQTSDQQILFGGLREGIGISLDLKRGRMFVTDLGGNIYSARLDGSDRKTILTGQGTLTGIAYVDLSK